MHIHHITIRSISSCVSRSLVRFIERGGTRTLMRGHRLRVFQPAFRRRLLLARAFAACWGPSSNGTETPIQPLTLLPANDGRPTLSCLAIADLLRPFLASFFMHLFG